MRDDLSIAGPGAAEMRAPPSTVPETAREVEVRLRRSIRRLQVLSSLAEHLLEGHDCNSEVFPALFAEAHHDLGIDAFHYFRSNGPGEALELTFAAMSGGDEAEIDSAHLAAGQNLAAAVAASREPLHVTGIAMSDDPQLTALRDLGIRCYACEPVAVGKRLFGVVGFASRHEDRFTATDLPFFRAVARHLAVARDRDEQVVALKICNGELQHRVNNILSMVHAISVLSGKSAGDVGSFQAKFGERIAALARTHNLMTRDRTDVKLRELLCVELQAYDEPGRIRMHGRSVGIPSQVALFLAMAIHELASNAVEHGALAVEKGILQLFWTVQRTSRGRVLTLEWIEEGFTVPDRDMPSGFGTRLLDHSVGRQVNVSRDFTATGLRAVIEVAVD